MLISNQSCKVLDQKKAMVFQAMFEVNRNLGDLTQIMAGLPQKY